MSDAAVLYHEPGIVTILIQSSFILALNIVDFVLDKAIYCGLIGQILVGMAYGTPGGDILGLDIQQAITDLGYLGLILLVFEGGLSTDIHALRQNLVLSSMVALTGIMLPIGISFVLIEICNATILQAFAAGCALSSTSLGTTFTILKSSGLDNSRLGVVLTSAAMLDDVVGLVLVQVIGNLGNSAERGFTATTVVRPVFVSIAYAILVPVLLLLAKVLMAKIDYSSLKHGKVMSLATSPRGRFLSHTALLLCALASAAYAGTSVLFAAYLAGLLISSASSLDARSETSVKSTKAAKAKYAQPEASPAVTDLNASEAWEMVTPPAVATGPSEVAPEPSDAPPARQEELQQPRNANTGEEQAKMGDIDAGRQTRSSGPEYLPGIYESYYANAVDRILKPLFFASIGFSIPITRLFDPSTLWRGVVYAVLMTIGKLACGLWLVRFSKLSPAEEAKSSSVSKARSGLTKYRPKSLYPAGLLGNAMVARGEIGFLISAIAQSNGIFEQDGARVDIFLVATWAILLCTIIGPVTVGLLTRRVKRLRNAAKASDNGRNDPLGVWADIKQ